MAEVEGGGARGSSEAVSGIGGSGTAGQGPAVVPGTAEPDLWVPEDSGVAAPAMGDPGQSADGVPDPAGGRAEAAEGLASQAATRAGGEDEAFYYAATNISGWKKAAGALDWLEAQTSIKAISRGGKA